MFENMVILDMKTVNRHSAPYSKHRLDKNSLVGIIEIYGLLIKG